MLGFDDAPLVVAYGLGVDSTALLVGLADRAIRPDAILFADVGGEKEETYAYLPIIQKWLASEGFPPVTVVRNVVSDFKHWPPYETLEENCLTNGTLPSLAFGFKSCSIKWKHAPQDRWLKRWAPAVECWAAGGRVRKMIGFDAGPADQRRRCHAGSMEDRRYEYEYPLIGWGWERERCKKEIESAGLPVPPKSSCFFCPSMKPAEVRDLPADKLKRIVVMEARAKPRLDTIDGLWRKGCKGTRGAEKKPGAITEFIRAEGLLPSQEIDRLASRVPLRIVDDQRLFAEGQNIGNWQDFFCSL